MMRPMVMDFNGDTAAVNRQYQFMFGRALLVAPVTEPNVTQTDVYLPKNSAWYDFWTGQRYTGGQTIKADAPLDKIPSFIKAGTILPIGPVVQYSSEKKWNKLEIRIYPGANGSYTLYEDEGDNYNYEKGAYSAIFFNWNDTKKTLTIDDRKGAFKGILTKREFDIVFVTNGKGTGMESTSNVDNIVKYNGKKVVVNIK